MCKIKVTVARPLSDEKAFCRRHAQAIQGHMSDFDPSVGVLGRFIVVPETQASNALGSVKVDHNHMVQPRGKGDQPHVLILGGDVHAID